MTTFELSEGLIIMPLSVVYGRTEVHARALVDTGSGGTAVDINLVELDRRCPARIVEIAGVGGKQDVIIHKADAINFCGVKVSDFEVEFGDITSSFGFDAIVGSDLLDFLGVCIDYEQREIRVGAR
jgi:hypothetical protein